MHTQCFSCYVGLLLLFELFFGAHGKSYFRVIWIKFGFSFLLYQFRLKVAWNSGKTLLPVYLGQADGNSSFSCGLCILGFSSSASVFMFILWRKRRVIPLRPPTYFWSTDAMHSSFVHEGCWVAGITVDMWPHWRRNVDISWFWHDRCFQLFGISVLKCFCPISQNFLL